MSNLKKWLAQRKEQIEEGVAKGKERKGIAELPDGQYFAVYRVHEFGESQNENVGLKTCLRVIEGELTGEDIWIWEDLDRDNAFEWLVVRLKNSGVELEDQGDLYDQLANNASDVFDLVKNRVVVKIALKSKKAMDGNVYQNKNVLKFMEDYEFDEDILKTPESKKSTEKAVNKSDKDNSSDEEDDEDDTGDLAVGMRVQFKKGKSILEGEVIAINAQDEIAEIKTDDGKVHEVGADAITGTLEDEDV